MPLDLEDPPVAALARRLSAYGLRALAAAGGEALWIHAEEVGPEHLLRVLLADEDSAAHQAVLAAFADPETIASEILALADGILVVGSRAALPFSPRAVAGLFSARARAAERGASVLDTGAILAQMVRELDGEVRDALAEAGLSLDELEPTGGPGGVRVEGPLFRDTTEGARRVLSRAGRLAAGEGDPSIAPGHVVLAALDDDRELSGRAGLGAARARLVLSGRTRDETPIADRPLPASEELLTVLGILPEEAGSLAMMRAFHAGGTAEIAGILTRHRVTGAFLERADRGLRDPD